MVSNQWGIRLSATWGIKFIALDTPKIDLIMNMFSIKAS
jgi:hypothetical protein